MPRNNTNPYAPPKEYTKPTEPRIPKYEKPLIDWAGLIIIVGSLSVMITITILALLLFGKS